MGSSIRVLHLDTDEAFLELSAESLTAETERLAVETTQDPEEALDTLHEEPIDCVVTAYRLQETTGIEFLQRVRERNQTLPIILFTGEGSEQIASEAISAGVTDYIQKGDSEQFLVLANRIVRAVEAHVARSRVRRRERDYRRLVDTAPIPMVVVNADREILYLNAAGGDVLGLERTGEAVGDPVSDFLHDDDRTVALETIDQVFETRAPVDVQEYRVTDTNGETRYVQGNIVPVVFDGREAAQFAGVDVTARKRRRRELERQNERLDKFAAVVSHDLRNPLNVAQLRLDLEQRDHDSENLDAVEHAHERIETLVETLLQLTRHGESVTDSEPVELSTLVETCWQTTETSGATLENATDSVVFADETRLRQLFENLFRNSVEHGASLTEATGPVSITVGDLSDGFYVADNGPGIPEELREEVFAFGTTSSDEGTGFGLSIVREIVEAHDWDIAATASDDGGARFEVTGVSLVSD